MKKATFSIFSDSIWIIYYIEIIASKDFPTGIISVSSISREIRESEQVRRANCRVSIVVE